MQILPCNVSETPLFSEPSCLMQEGEMALLKGDLSKGLELFAEASKQHPPSGDLFYRQGLALFHYAIEKKDEKILSQAHKKLKLATSFSTNSFSVWHTWGLILVSLGEVSGVHSYFLGAQEKYNHAQKLTTDEPPDILADFYWDRAHLRAHLATHSEEPLDWQLCLDAFHKASELQQELPSEFWHDFGSACTQLAHRISDIRLYVKAINCFRHALTLLSSSFPSWLSLGKTLYSLYEFTHDEDHFLQANECFAAASGLEPQNSALWLEWASYLLESGRRNHDIKRLRTCIEKCHKAHVYDPKEPRTKALWGEALALIGEASERLDLIYDGQNKIAEALEEDPSLPELWYASGNCMCAFAFYFNDTDFYCQAIEKFQYGLSLDRTCHILWHAMAQTYAIIGTLDADKESFDKAARFFTKAIDLHPSSHYIFDFGLALSKVGEMTHNQRCLEHAVLQFEKALSIQKNATYLHPDWLYQYAYALDMLGDFHEDESYYSRAIDIFSHVLMLDPDFSQAHHKLALALSHLGELLGDVDHFCKAIHHFRLASKQEEENDLIILDWGVCLINLAEHSQDAGEKDLFYRESEYKLTHAARLGNVHAYYHLAGLYSILCQYDKAMCCLEKALLCAALPPIEEVLEDDWLDGLRNTSDFRNFLAELEKKPNLHEER